MEINDPKIIPIFLLIVALFFGIYLVLDYYGVFNKEEFTAKVIALEGSNILYLSNNMEVLLAGVRIPETDEVNYDKELTDNFRNYIVGKEMRFRIILPKLKYQRYPLYNTVLAYLPDGELINDIILKEGMAFFDHGWYPHKRRFEKIERQARENKNGLWQNIDKYKLLYVSGRRFVEYHLQDCIEIKNANPKEVTYYYYFQPPSIFFYRYAGDCITKKWKEEQAPKPAQSHKELYVEGKTVEQFK